MACFVQAAPRDGSFSIFGGLFLACSGQAAPRDGSFPVFGGLFSAFSSQATPRGRNFSNLVGPIMEMSENSAPRIRCFSNLGGPIIKMSENSAPRDGSFPIFGGCVADQVSTVAVYELPTAYAWKTAGSITPRRHGRATTPPRSSASKLSALWISCSVSTGSASCSAFSKMSLPPFV